MGLAASAPTMEVGAGASGRARKRRRRAAGLAGSALLHTLFLLLCAASLKGAQITGGGGAADGEVNAINVSLAGLKGPRADPSAQSAAALNALFLKIRAQQQAGLAAQDKQKPLPQDNLARLFDVVADHPATKGGGQSDTDQGGSGSQVSAADKDAPQKLGPAKAPPRPGSGSAASAGDLWGQIQPCWDRLPAVASVPVSLEITLDARGLIATPPKIVRSGGAPDERRLISEARALAAITACVPYRPVVGIGDRRVFRVEFAGR